MDKMAKRPQPPREPPVWLVYLFIVMVVLGTAMLVAAWILYLP
jgi:hypothetical protein